MKPLWHRHLHLSNFIERAFALKVIVIIIIIIVVVVIVIINIFVVVLVHEVSLS